MSERTCFSDDGLLRCLAHNADWPSGAYECVAARPHVHEYRCSCGESCPQPPSHTRLVLVTEDADTLFFGRAEDGSLLTFSWGEPDANGWYEPTITAHYDQRLPCPHVAALRDLVDATNGIRWHVGGEHDGPGFVLLDAIIKARAALDGEQVDEAGVPQRSQGNARGGG